MNLTKTLALAAAAAALTLAGAQSGHAWTVPTGSTAISSCTSNGTLSNGQLFTLYTNVYQTGGLYTTQYDLKNVSDTAGLTTFSANFGYAGDYGTPAMKMFFGDAPNSSGIVYHDGNVGDASSSTSANPIKNSGTVDYKVHAPTMEAYAQNGQVVWQDLSAPIAQGQDMVSQLGYNGGAQYGSFGYLYIQSKTAPVQNTIYVADKGGAFANITDCAGSSPCHNTPPPPAAVPEPSAVASMGLGSLGLLGLLLRNRKRAFKA